MGELLLRVLAVLVFGAGCSGVSSKCDECPGDVLLAAAPAAAQWVGTDRFQQMTKLALNMHGVKMDWSDEIAAGD